MTERPTDYDYAATYGDFSIWDEYRGASLIPIEDDPISIVVRDFVELCQNMLDIANRIRALYDEAKLGYGNNFAGDIFKKNELHNTVDEYAKLKKEYEKMVEQIKKHRPDFDFKIYPIQ